MKITARCALVLLALAATGAMAQQSTVQIRASETKTVTLRHGEFNDYASVYQLSNGRYIKFSAQQRRYYAMLDKGERIEIRPISRTDFVTAAGTHIAFRDSGEEVTISNYEHLPMAGTTLSNVTMVASR
jgi:hypothetical protein